ncbi:MAG: caspase family protein [SAR324 cluster bacterium]|nr:caspase family protein [SAR324 cluster bacterium]
MKSFLKLFYLTFICWFSLSCLAIAQDSRAFKKKAGDQEQHIALIIGNANYESSPLRNPGNDAHDIAAVLKKKGFDVTLQLDGTKREMENEIRKFGKNLQKGGVGFFYYAGHGMQVKGVNYLIPIKTNIESEDDIPYEAVNANMVLSKMDTAGNRLNMVFLDACRDNPFARSFRSGSKGLAQMDAPSGTLVGYATSPGKTAADGTGRNGVFTSNFLKQIEQPGLEIGMMMRKVRTGVRSDTGGKQTPWDVSSLEGEFYFNPPVQKQQMAVVTQPPTRPSNVTAMPPVETQSAPVTTIPSRQFSELGAWKAIKYSKNPASFQKFLKQYPNSDFAPLARMQISRLETPATAETTESSDTINSRFDSFSPVTPGRITEGRPTGKKPKNIWEELESHEK